jgi:SP family myo-inositol transporter-like MFS transporter 13
MVGLGAVPAALQLLTLLFMPETPRWLVKAEKVQQARRVLGKVYGTDSDAIVEGILKNVGDEIEEEEMSRKFIVIDPDENWFGAHLRAFKYTFNELVHIGGNARALTVACMLQGSQQLCGFVGFPSLTSHFDMVLSEP